MGHKDHIMVQKGLRMHEKRQKMEFLDQKNLFFCGIFRYVVFEGLPIREAWKLKASWGISIVPYTTRHICITFITFNYCL